MILATRAPHHAPTIGALVRYGERALEPSDTARLDSELLLAEAINSDRAGLYRDRDQHVDTVTVTRFDALLAARARGKPVAQLLGRCEFWSLPLILNEFVLAPRPETEHLVETALELIENRPRPRVADLGTGSGAVALAIATERPDATVMACDRSDGALDIAARNRRRLAIATVSFVRCNWLASYRSNWFDLLVANPPYVQASDPRLTTTELRFEPRSALAAGDDGLDDIRAIIAQAPRVMKTGSWLALEHGHEQGVATRELFNARGFSAVASNRDLAGHERVTYGRWCRRA